MLVYSDKNCDKRPLIINHDTVYLRSNFKEVVDGEGTVGYEFEERQLTLLEYLKEAFPENQVSTDKAIAELLLLFSAYQESVDTAIAELSVLLGGIQNV